MRTKTLLLTAALGAAGIITSLAQDPVYSVNAVGYVNKTLVAGFTMISNPLNTGGNMLSEVIPNAEIGTTVFAFDAAAGNFVSSTYLGVWSADLEMPPGVGAFVNSTAEQTITFVGEVPQGSLSVALPSGLSLIGSPVPQAGQLDTDLGLAPEVGDTIFKWDTTAQDYVSSTYLGVWSDAAAATIEVAEGVFYSSSSDKSWDRDFSVND
jgi:hypothetical protein